jgi:hypothetical protein
VTKNKLENADLCVDLAEVLDLGAGLLCLLHQNHGGGDQRSLSKLKQIKFILSSLLFPYQNFNIFEKKA